jgi:hypothetical protein
MSAILTRISRSLFTAQPSTAKPVTAQPFTAEPSTAQPFTAQPFTAQPFSCAPDCTFEFMCDSNHRYYRRQCCYNPDCSYFCGGWSYIGSC